MFEPYLSECGHGDERHCCDAAGNLTHHENVVASEADQFGRLLYRLDGWEKYWCWHDMPKWLVPRYRDLDALQALARGSS